jgi:hypothetical protein
MSVNTDNLHSVEIILRGLYPMGEEEQVRLKVSGDGSLEYFVDTMQAALVAFGFSPETVSKIGFVEKANEE